MQAEIAAQAVLAERAAIAHELERAKRRYERARQPLLALGLAEAIEIVRRRCGAVTHVDFDPTSPVELNGGEVV